MRQFTLYVIGFVLFLGSFAAVSAAAPAAPSNLVATHLGDGDILLTWADNSTDESGFAIYIRATLNADFTQIGIIAANQTSATLNGASPIQAYQFLILAFNDNGQTISNVYTLEAFTELAIAQPFVGQPYLFQTGITNLRAAASITFSASGLPSWATVNPETGAISGTPTEPGPINVTLTAHYSDGHTLSRQINRYVIHPAGPPVAIVPIPPQNLFAGASPAILPLDGFFTDPDTESAVEFQTSKGNFHIALYPSATPITVANFLSYVNSGRYDGSIVHRSPANFIIQGGGFKPTPPNFTSIPRDPSPPNEPVLSNLRGTIAMAKAAGSPNSATSEWFINVNVNTPTILDSQNSGFSAFGRVLGDGMSIVDGINQLPRANYNVLADGSPRTFTDCPVDAATAPPTIDLSKLVVVHSVAPAAPLTFSIAGNTDPAVATAAIDSGALVITPVSPGDTTLTITAIDLDGNSIQKSIEVTVNPADSFTAWVTRQNFASPADAEPLADPERDGAQNLIEYAFRGQGTAFDAPSILPSQSFAAVSGENRLAITFDARKDAPDIRYTVEAASNVAGPWTAIWDSTQSHLLPPVAAAEEFATYRRLTVHDTSPGTSARFLRVKIETIAP